MQRVHLPSRVWLREWIGWRSTLKRWVRQFLANPPWQSAIEWFNLLLTHYQPFSDCIKQIKNLGYLSELVFNEEGSLDYDFKWFDHLMSRVHLTINYYVFLFILRFFLILPTLSLSSPIHYSARIHLALNSLSLEWLSTPYVLGV